VYTANRWIAGVGSTRVIVITIESGRTYAFPVVAEAIRNAETTAHETIQRLMAAASGTIAKILCAVVLIITGTFIFDAVTIVVGAIAHFSGWSSG
jgi:hypothetical protein